MFQVFINRMQRRVTDEHLGSDLLILKYLRLHKITKRQNVPLLVVTHAPPTLMRIVFSSPENKLSYFLFLLKIYAVI